MLDHVSRALHGTGLQHGPANRSRRTTSCVAGSRQRARR